MRSMWMTALAGAFVASLVMTNVAAADPKYPTMAPLDQYLIADRNAEIALARSAAPPAISNDATILVLTRKGYEKAVDGKNGFVCLVDRAWQSALDDPELWNPNTRGPTCLNPPAVRSVLPFQHQLTALALSGATREQMIARVKQLLATQSFVPETGAMSYMMSKQQHLNDRDVHWHPHVMFYFPSSVVATTLGANVPAASVFGGETDVAGLGRMPVSLFFVPVEQWSDGTPAMMHEMH